MKFCICNLVTFSFPTDTDYSDEQFPNGACIVDYLRCSITFKTPKELLTTLNTFINKIENGEGKAFAKILRIKNGFKNTLKWTPKNMSDYNYVDLKINVIFNNKHNTEAQLVELQFLLNFLLKAKKLGHKYYGIKRKDIQVLSVSNIMYDTYNDDVKYKRKILGLIEDGNLNQLSRHLFLRPNCILSMINNEIPTPLLYHVLHQPNSSKMKSFFLDCLFHFGEILLSEKKPLNYNTERYTSIKKKIYNVRAYDKTREMYDKLYIQKYLNYSFGGGPLFDTKEFVKYI